MLYNQIYVKIIHTIHTKIQINCNGLVTYLVIEDPELSNQWVPNLEVGGQIFRETVSGRGRVFLVYYISFSVEFREYIDTL